MDIDSCTAKFISSAKVERNLSERTIKAYTSDLRPLSEYFVGKNVNEITTDDLRGYLRTLEENNYHKDTTIRRRIATMKVFFGFLEDENAISLSPARKIKKKYEIAKHLPRVIPLREVKRLLRAPSRERKSLEDTSENNGSNTNHQLKQRMIRCCRDKAILELLFSTGMRIGELVNLNLSDVDFSARTMLIFGKGRRERLVYLSSDEVMESVKEYLSYRMGMKTSSPAIFLNRFGEGLTIYSVENIFRRYCKMARIKKHYTPHCLRHTMATMLSDNGADIREVQEILGHASIATTQIYTYVSAERKRKVLMKFNQRNRMKIS